MEKFQKYCPDGYKFLKSLNPIAKNQTRAMFYAFKQGYWACIHSTEDERINIESVYAGQFCQDNCPYIVCDLTPNDCEKSEKYKSALSIKEE